MDQPRKALSNFSTILTESLKLMFNNKKLIATITAFSLISSSILLLSFIFLANLMYDVSILVKYYWILLLIIVQIALMLAVVAISLISNIAMIYVASTSNKNTTTRDLLAVIKATWKKQLVINSRTSQSMYPYFIGIIAVMMLLQICPINIVTASVTVLLGVSGFFYYLYLSVVWELASVVVVVEGSIGSGEEAIKRSGMLVEGKKWDGFVVNLIYNLVFMVVLVVYGVVIDGEGFTSLMVFWVLMPSVVCLMRVILIHAYVVLYFQCKKNRDEEIELVLGNLDYSRLANDIP